MKPPTVLTRELSREAELDALVDAFTAPYLLSIARHRNYALTLSPDGAAISFDPDAPIWFGAATIMHYGEILALMRTDFLGRWDEKPPHREN